MRARKLHNPPRPSRMVLQMAESLALANISEMLRGRFSSARAPEVGSPTSIALDALLDSPHIIKEKAPPPAKGNGAFLGGAAAGDVPAATPRRSR